MKFGFSFVFFAVIVAIVVIGTECAKSTTSQKNAKFPPGTRIFVHDLDFGTTHEISPDELSEENLSDGKQKKKWRKEPTAPAPRLAFPDDCSKTRFIKFAKECGLSVSGSILRSETQVYNEIHYFTSNDKIDSCGLAIKKLNRACPKRGQLIYPDDCYQHTLTKFASKCNFDFESRRSGKDLIFRSRTRVNISRNVKKDLACNGNIHILNNMCAKSFDP